MKDPRLVYRVILKLFAALGSLILLYVLFSSLFVKKEKVTPTVKTNPIIKIDLAGMQKDGVRKVRWQGRQIIILKSQDKREYSVYYNTGDSGNCPLYYASDVFKDTCTGTLYDKKGRQLNSSSPKLLQSPPYYIEGEQLIMGKQREGIQQ